MSDKDSTAVFAASVGTSFTNLVDTDGVVIKTVDMHTGGEPLRIIVSGCPTLSAKTILKKRGYMNKYLDHIRHLLMFEPRDHFNMYGALVVLPDDREADAGVLFMHNEGYGMMCGHAIIALGRYFVDYKYVSYQEPETQVNIQCPRGLVKSYVQCSGGKTGNVRFESVVAFVFETDLEVDVPGFGKVTVDVSYGGAFYAFVPDSSLGISLSTSSIAAITDAAWAVTEAVKTAIVLDHPESSSLAFLNGTIVTDGNDTWSEEPTSNICMFAEKEIDRSPTGSGVTARVALQYHKKLIKFGQTRVFENAKTKSRFTGKPLREAPLGKYNGVVVEVSGRAYYTGENHFILEEGDELGKGFLIH